MAKTELPAQHRPGDVWFEDDELRPGAWAKAMIQRASRVKMLGISPVEEVALYRALLKRPAVRKFVAESRKAVPEGGGRAAPAAPVTTKPAAVPEGAEDVA